MRVLATFAFAVMLICLGALPGHAERRVALIIGNGDYAHADKLANPVTDARRLQEALKPLHFEIVYGENLGKQALERTIGRFANAVQDSDVALVFFAGHGATFGDTPYVVPVDAQFSSLGEVPYELVQVETLIGELRRAKGLRIAILDACRDNSAERELKRKAARGGEVTRGLMRPKNVEGLILAYATQYLSTAADGDPRGDSPFTTALLNNIATPGLDVKELFFKVGSEVIAATKGEQRPEISVSFYDRYALVPPGTVAPVQAPGQPATDPCAAAGDHWRSAEAIGSLAAFEDHLARFPNCVFAGLARAQIAELKKKIASVQPAAPPSVAPAASSQQSAPQRQQVAAAAPPSAPASPCSAGPTVASLSSRRAQPLSTAEECALKPRDAFRECDKCPEMVVVPAGSFTMGSPANEAERSGYEGPQHTVTISKPFAVGRFAVTFEEWDACVADGGCNAYKPPDNSWGRGRQPVINVSWDDAKAYVAWISRKTGKGYHLLSEAEQEYATRAGTTTPFWWGASISTSQANYDGTSTYGGGSKGEYRKRTVPVDSFQPNPWGLYQVHGNVYDRVEDCYHGSYAGAPSDGSAWVSGDCSHRVVRGGSWLSNPADLRSAHRNGYVSGSRYLEVGFRVARTL